MYNARAQRWNLEEDSPTFLLRQLSFIPAQYHASTFLTPNDLPALPADHSITKIGRDAAQSSCALPQSSSTPDTQPSAAAPLRYPSPARFGGTAAKSQRHNPHFPNPEQSALYTLSPGSQASLQQSPYQEVFKPAEDLHAAREALLLSPGAQGAALRPLSAGSLEQHHR